MPCPRRITFCLVLLLAGCATAQKTPSSAAIVASTPPADSALATEIETGWGRVLAASLSEGWLRAFGDPDLEKIVAEALRHNREPAATSASLQTAGQFAAEAGAALAAAVDDGGAASTDSFGSSLNLQWERDIWARLSPLAGTAAPPVSATDLEAARLSLIAQTAKAWFLASETNLQLALARQAVEIRQQQLQLAASRADAGDAATTDIAGAEAELAVAGERQRLAIAALIPALRGIAAILGRFPAAELTELREQLPLPPPIPAGIPAALLERRPDLAAAERRVEDAFRLPPANGAAALPRLPLTAVDGSASAELTALLATGNRLLPRGAPSALPLEAGDGRGSSSNPETAQRRAALQAYDAIAQRAFGEVAVALAAESRSRQRAAASAASLAAIAAELAAVESGGDNGEPPAVLRLQARALASRIALTRAQYALLAQRVDLHLALGGDFSP